MTIKPTVQSIENTLSTLRDNYYRQRDIEIKTDVELYRQAFKLDFPEGGGFHEVKSPNTRNIADRFADRIGKGRLVAHMDARKPGGDEKKHVEILERAAVAIPELARKRAKFNPNRGMALHSANRGAFVVKFQVDMKAFLDPPKRKDGWTDGRWSIEQKLHKFRQLEQFPLQIDVRPIESIYPDPGTDGDEYVIEHYERTAGDIRKNLPHWAGWATEPTGTKNERRKTGKLYEDNDRVKYTEVWTREWRAVLVDGEFVPLADGLPAAPVPNPYGRPPYWIRYPFGDPAAPPEERCVGLLRAIRWTAKSESRMLSIIDTLAENEAYGATIISSKDQAAEETMSFAPGAVIKTDTPDKPPRPYAPQNNLDKVMAAFGLIQTQTERGSVPSAAIGQFQNAPGASGAPPSGVAASILTGESSMVIDPVKTAIEDFYGEFVPFVFFVLDAVVKKNLTVYGMVGDNVYFNVDLNSETIDEHYGPVHFTLQMRSPEDDFAKMNVGAQLMDKLPLEFVLEKFFGIENANETVKRMTIQKIVQSEEVVKGYLIPRLIEQLQAEDRNIAASDPGHRVAAPLGAPMDPMAAMVEAGLGAPQPTSDVTSASLDGMDLPTRAAMRVAPGPVINRGPNVVTPGGSI